MRQAIELCDVRIFMGRGSDPASSEEIRLDPVGDDYISLSAKTKEAQRWAVDRLYDFVFKADVDTYISPLRLMASGFECHDYSGWFNHQPSGIVRSGYASGGSGYWTSLRASRLIADSPERHVSEDRSVGIIMNENKIPGFNDPRYLRKGALGPDGITTHLHRYPQARSFSMTGNYDPQWMYEMHKQEAGS